MPDNAEPVSIARLITWLPVGGIERKLIAVLARLDRRKFTPMIICLRERGILADDAEKLGIPVTVCQLRSRIDPASIWRLSRLLRERKVQLVHTHMYRANTSGTIAAKLARVPVNIANIHNLNTWETRRQLWQDRLLTRGRDAVIAVSQAVADDYRSRIPQAAGKLHVIYNGVDESVFYPGQDSELQESLSLPPEIPVIGIIGRLVEHKGHDLLLLSLSRLPADLPWRLLIVGDGPNRGHLQELTLGLGLSGKVSFLGLRHDIGRIMRVLNIFTLPSRREGFANVILEGMASGLPCVVTAVGGNPEAVVDGETGFLIAADDGNALYAHLRTLLTDAELRRAMSAAALERSKLFSLGKMVQRIEELYSSLLARKPAR